MAGFELVSIVKLKYLNRGFCVPKLHVKHFVLCFNFKYEIKIISLKLQIEIFGKFFHFQPRFLILDSQ